MGRVFISQNSHPGNLPCLTLLLEPNVMASLRLLRPSLYNSLSLSLGQLVPPLVLVGLKVVTVELLLFLGLRRLPSGSLHPTYTFKNSLFASKPSSKGFNLSVLFVFC